MDWVLVPSKEFYKMALLFFLIFGCFYLLLKIGFSIIRFFGGILALLIIVAIFTRIIIWGFWLGGIALVVFVAWLGYEMITRNAR